MALTLVIECLLCRPEYPSRQTGEGVLPRERTVLEE